MFLFAFAHLQRQSSFARSQCSIEIWPGTDFFKFIETFKTPLKDENKHFHPVIPILPGRRHGPSSAG
jgi:hypothetical protein